jgi:hypothetical protein
MLTALTPFQAPVVSMHGYRWSHKTLQIKKAFSGIERPTTYSIILIFSPYLDQVSRGNSDIGYQSLIYVPVPLASGPFRLSVSGA